jgi:DNA-binding FadR family transcriptional regulator
MDEGGPKLDDVIKIPKAGELVAQKLRSRILRGELKEGENLQQENELLEIFQVSRPTLREAIRILESEGLVSVSRGARAGAVVHEPDVRVSSRYFGFLLQAQGVTFDDVFRTLSFVEPTAARWHAENRTGVAPLKKLLREVGLNVHDDERYSALISAFHRELVSLTGVPALILLMDMIANIIESYYSEVSLIAGGKVDNSRSKQSGHKARMKLIAMIEEGDGVGAETLWRSHLTKTHEIMLRWLPSDRVVNFSEVL